MWYTTDGTFKENLKSTASLYVVVIPHGIGEAVLISLTVFSCRRIRFGSLHLNEWKSLDVTSFGGRAEIDGPLSQITIK